MTKEQITITNDKRTTSHALWWRPFLYMQQELNDSCKKAACDMTSHMPFVESFWEAEETMLRSAQYKTHQIFSQIFNQRQMMMPWLSGHATEPFLDIVDSEKAVEVKADVAGMEADDIQVFIEDHAIKICGERKDKKEVKEYDYIRHECHCGNFSRTIALPENADTDNASATLDQHVLTIHVPKSQNAMGRKKQPVDIDDFVPTKPKPKPEPKPTSIRV